jgi:hypothetical protein
MIQNLVPQNASLGSVLHARALATPPLRLALDIAVGSIVAGVAYWVHPFWWVLATAAGICFAGYGVWAFAERRLETVEDEMSRGSEFAWNAMRTLAAIVGLAAALVLTFSVVSVMLGSWIS